MIPLAVHAILESTVEGLELRTMGSFNRRAKSGYEIGMDTLGLLAIVAVMATGAGLLARKITISKGRP